MSLDTQKTLVNGPIASRLEQLNSDLGNAKHGGNFHGDDMLADKENATTGSWADIRDVVTLKNLGSIGAVGSKLLRGKGLDVSFARR